MRLSLRQETGVALLALASLDAAIGGYCLWHTPRGWEAAAALVYADDIRERLDQAERARFSAFRGSVFIQTEAERIQSRMVLVPVIGKFKLDEQWAGLYQAEAATGSRLTTNDTLLLLRRRLRVAQFDHSPLIRVAVECSSPREAIDVANEIVTSYVDARGQLSGLAPQLRLVARKLLVVRPAGPRVRLVRPTWLHIGTVLGLATLAAASGFWCLCRRKGAKGRISLLHPCNPRNPRLNALHKYG